MLEILVGIAILIGLIGIVVPPLPGSMLIGAAVLVWAAFTGRPAAWAVAVICALLVVGGMALTWYFTAKYTRVAGVPNGTLVIAGLAGIVGFFVVPVIGLVLFFLGGLFVAEYVRMHDPRRAWRSALAALKGTGLGMLVELGLALVASGLWLGAALSGV